MGSCHAQQRVGVGLSKHINTFMRACTDLAGARGRTHAVQVVGRLGRAQGARSAGVDAVAAGGYVQAVGEALQWCKNWGGWRGRGGEALLQKRGAAQHRAAQHRGSCQRPAGLPLARVQGQKAALQPYS